MKFEIAEGVALDSATQIEKIVSDFNADMDNLNNILTHQIDEGIQTDWAQTVKNNWVQYYNNDIENTKTEMLESARDLEKAVEAWKAYNSGS